MIEFRGIGAALQALQFIFRRPVPFLKLTLAWALIRVACTSGGGRLLHAAGFNRPLFGYPSLLDSNFAGLAILWVPHLLATVAIGVYWIRYVLLDEEPRNPVRLSGEMGVFFGQSLAISSMSAASAVPGIALLLYAVENGVRATKIAVLIWAAAGLMGLLAALIPPVVIYGRLLIILAAAAVDDIEVRFRRALELTRGHTLSLTGGMLIAYIVPLIAGGAIEMLIAMITAAVPGVAVSVALTFVRYVVNCSNIVILAGFTANIYAGLMPIDVGDKIAKQFD